MTERPLSPHLSVYRWAYTNTLSILHRMTGIALVGAFIVAICWLGAAAAGPDAYASAMSLLGALPVKLVIAFALLALCYHFCSGLRHLAWDAGYGFERAQARRSAVAVVVITLLAGLVLVYVLFRSGGGAV